ncbi:MAG: hypothetical protein OEV79_09845 [candidate division WOR-3 bacterium]|nr:hypothetical protein [candidate division WOR-3 bacterium]
MNAFISCENIWICDNITTIPQGSESGNSFLFYLSNPFFCLNFLKIFLFLFLLPFLLF